jgi:hypothetical protein
MTITLDLQPEIEKGLAAQARARGVSLSEYVQAIVVREANASQQPGQRTGQELIDICAKVRGILTDEEADMLFRRNPSPGRAVDLG